MDRSDHLPQVKAQYEELPYPIRDPEDEKRRLLGTTGGSLTLLNHHLYGGNRDFRKNFRVLVAGGGTGDCLIYLAEQLRNFDAEIVYLDFSSASRQVAEARARIRGLDNIHWVTDSILKLPELGLGKFDYINCSGVLHHLESPEKGLESLTSVLKDDGGMYLMLYGQFGRRAIYETQQLLRTILDDSDSIQEKIELARGLLEQLPESNVLKREYAEWEQEISSDNGLLDLLLHDTDQAYSVPEVYAFAASAGLKVNDFVGPRAANYAPEAWLPPSPALDRISKLKKADRQAVAELLYSKMIKHEFLLSRKSNTQASLKDESLALLANESMFINAPKIAASMIDGNTINYAEKEWQLPIHCNPISKIIFAKMDGSISIKKLKLSILKSVPGVTAADIDTELARIFKSLHGRSYLYLVNRNLYGKGFPDMGALVRDNLPSAE